VGCEEAAVAALHAIQLVVLTPNSPPMYRFIYRTLVPYHGTDQRRSGPKSLVPRKLERVGNLLRVIRSRYCNVTFRAHHLLTEFCDRKWVATVTAPKEITLKTIESVGRIDLSRRGGLNGQR
jgi:hypothetical protein